MRSTAGRTPASRLLRIGLNSKVAAVVAMGALLVSGCSGGSSEAAPSKAKSGTPAPMKASPAGIASSAAPVYTDGEDRSGDGDDSSAIVDYWTDEQLAEAIPVDEPAGPGEVTDGLDRDASESVPEEVLSKPAEALVEDRTGGDETHFSPTNGKVFFRNAKTGKDYVCSGSAVNSGSKSLVATAGHCVHGGPGGDWHENWVFIPSFSQKSRPYGSFAAASMYTASDWIDYGGTPRGFDSDIAFVSTYPNADGTKVVDAVGGHGLMIGYDQSYLDVNVVGYPANLDKGLNMLSCEGRTEPRRLGDRTFLSVSGCGFGGGSSGGPWLMDYNAETGIGTIKTVTSWVPSGSTASINGPYLGEAARSLYYQADDAS